MPWHPRSLGTRGCLGAHGRPRRPLSPAPHVAAKDWEKSVAINATATATLIRFVEPLLLAAEAGHALFFEDARGGVKFFGSYGATKAAQIALARSWAAETANTAPRVSVLDPAAMPTATRARFFPGEDRSGLAEPMAEAKRLLAQAGIQDA